MPLPTTKSVRVARRLRRGNPRLEEHIHDPYRSAVKSRGPARCTHCGALYRNGRWTWEWARAARTLVCPACRRSNDRYPAGELTLSGAFLLDHADEVLRLVRNVEKVECGAHPLHRIAHYDEAGYFLRASCERSE